MAKDTRPQQQPQPTPNRRRWEYRVLDLQHDPAAELQARLMEAGAEGWEAFSVVKYGNAHRVYFKRAVGP